MIGGHSPHEQGHGHRQQPRKILQLHHREVRRDKSRKECSRRDLGGKKTSVCSCFPEMGQTGSLQLYVHREREGKKYHSQSRGFFGTTYLHTAYTSGSACRGCRGLHRSEWWWGRGGGPEVRYGTATLRPVPESPHTGVSFGSRDAENECRTHLWQPYLE